VAAAEAAATRRHSAAPAVAGAAAAPLQGDDAYDDVEQANEGLYDEHDDAEDGVDHEHDGAADHGAEVGEAGQNGTHDGGVIFLSGKRWPEALLLRCLLWLS